MMGRRIGFGGPDGHQALAATVRPRRRAAAPAIAKPPIISAQVVGSGTAGGIVTVPPRTLNT
jgi:hypothetical protein